MADKNIKEFKKELAKAISYRLKKCRETKGLSYAELSQLTGISKSSLQRYETGVTQTISLSTLSLIENALNLESGYLLGWTEPASQKEHFCAENFKAPVNKKDDWALLTHKPVFDILKNKGTEANYLVFAADNSMEKSGIKNGATVFINTASLPEDGEIGAICFNNTTYICHIKCENDTWCFYTADANVIKFSSDLEKDNITCLGKAVAVLNIL